MRRARKAMRLPGRRTGTRLTTLAGGGQALPPTPSRRDRTPERDYGPANPAFPNRFAPARIATELRDEVAARDIPVGTQGIRRMADPRWLGAVLQALCRRRVTSSTRSSNSRTSLGPYGQDPPDPLGLHAPHDPVRGPPTCSGSRWPNRGWRPEAGGHQPPEAARRPRLVPGSVARLFGLANRQGHCRAR
jgi:hypothetical protein